MKILDDIFSGLDYNASVINICMGAFQTAVCSRRCGLASTPHEAGPHHKHFPVNGAGTLLEKDPRSLACLAKSENLFEAALGMATINSLLDANGSRFREINAAEILLEKGAGKNVTVIGHFPFIPSLRQRAGNLWVIEKNPREGDLIESEAENYIPVSDVVAITGTAFTNHTIENLLNLCSKKAYVMILGDTTPLTEVLFDYGINALSGTVVTEPEILLRCVVQGATFRQLKGIRLVTMENKSG